MANLLLLCSASAALHKAVDLASKLTQAGHTVRAALTPSAASLISPQLFEAVTGDTAASSEFGGERRTAMDHIDLGLWAEIVVAAPASADLVGRLAHGISSDLPVSASLAVKPGAPRLLCPAMNPHMLENPAVARNLQQLVEDGWQLVEPGAGHLACGVQGKGRLAEVPEITAAVAAALGEQAD